MLHDLPLAHTRGVIIPIILIIFINDTPNCKARVTRAQAHLSPVTLSVSG